MVNKRKKTQQTLPGFRAASGGHKTPANIGVTKWYYICDKKATVMLKQNSNGYYWADYDLQDDIPMLFTLGSAKLAARDLARPVIREWPYKHPSEWARIREEW